MLRVVHRLAGTHVLRGHGHGLGGIVAVRAATTLTKSSAGKLYDAASKNVIAPPKRGSNHRTILPLDNDEISPIIQPDCFVAPTASVIGHVMMNICSCTMNNTVLRGDLAQIHIGAFVMIEDECVLVAGSVANPSADINVEDYSQVGAGSVLRSCTIQRFCHIGNGSIVEENAFIGEGSILEPRTVVPAGTEIPPGQVWGGNPAKYRGEASKEFLSTREQEMKAMCAYIREAYKPMYLPYSIAWLEKEKHGRAAKSD
mmetsp:Transcript_4376/g.13253  ORF Transcript_4376/g.13253 Transcript_4376/m.13253 type:complete len:257 (+) Transcript_4376:336-1106(+)